MQNSDGVRAFETGDNLQHRVDCLRDRQRPAAFHKVVQRAAFNQLHDNDGRTFNLLGAVDIDAVWMIDRRREPSLADEALACLGRIERVAEHLQRDATSAREILRFVNRAHAPLAEQARDSIAAKFERLLDWSARWVLRIQAGERRRPHTGFGVPR